MKKLFYVAATALSLGVIFAAGWASGVGTVKEEQDTFKNIETYDDGCPDGGCGQDAPQNPEKRRKRKPDGQPDGENRFGFEIKMPVPPYSKIILP